METKKLGQLTIDSELMEASCINNTFVHLSGDENIGTLKLSGNIETQTLLAGTNNRSYSSGSIAAGQNNQVGIRRARVCYMTSADGNCSRVYLEKSANIDKLRVGEYAFMCLGQQFNNFGKIVSFGTDESMLSGTSLSDATKYVDFDGRPSVSYYGYKNGNNSFYNYETNDTVTVSTAGKFVFQQKRYGETWTPTVWQSGLNGALAEFKTMTSDGNNNYIKIVTIPDFGDATMDNETLNQAFGLNNMAYGDYATAFGRNNVAEGKYAFVNGSDNYAFYGSHAEGKYCSAFGYCDYAGGMYSHTNGGDAYPSFAHGYRARAMANNSYALGNYAYVSSNAKYSFVWNGESAGPRTSKEQPLSSYKYANAEGSFNIYPKNGISGFYIGKESLHTTLNGMSTKLKDMIFGPTPNYTVDEYYGTVYKQVLNRGSIQYVPENQKIAGIYPILSTDAGYSADLTSDCYRISAENDITCIASNSLSNITNGWVNNSSGAQVFYSFCGPRKEGREYANDHLKKIVLNDVKKIGNYSFMCLGQLEEAYFENAERIGTYAFKTCTRLSSLMIPNVERFDSSALNECFSLTSLKTPKLKSMYQGSLGNLKKLTLLDLRDNPDVVTLLDNPIVAGRTMRNHNANLSIVVEDSVFNEYQTANGWSELSSCFVKRSTYEGI